MFCDLRGFTAFTETSEPEEVMTVLREYHESLGELIFRYEGTLERFRGDGIMIVFNDPIPLRRSHRARRAAGARHAGAGGASWRQQWRRKGHDLGFGIGIAAGYATLGQIGFEQRREYTAIGSVINLASRLCDEARPGQIVIDQRAFGAGRAIGGIGAPREAPLEGVQPVDCGLPDPGLAGPAARLRPARAECRRRSSRTSRLSGANRRQAGTLELERI